jgi:hypothetical protein
MSTANQFREMAAQGLRSMREELAAPGLAVGIWLYRGVGDSLRSVRRYMPKSAPNRSIVCNCSDTEGTGRGAGSLPATVV